MSYDIFISYSHFDREKAMEIKKEIEKNTNAKCWMDMDGIESGSQFEHIIINAIDNAKIVVFLLSESSMKSGWTEKEVLYALNTGKKVIPLKIDDSKLEGWYLFTFGNKDIISYNNTIQKDKFIENIKKWTSQEGGDGGNGPEPTPPIEKPYFDEVVNGGIVFQLICLIAITLFCVYFLFSEGFIKTYLWGRDCCLIITLLSMIGSTILLKKHKFPRWSFWILDIVAIAISYWIGHSLYQSYASSDIKFSWGDFQFYELKDFCHHQINWLYIALLYILHNACIYVAMNSRILYNKFIKK